MRNDAEASTSYCAAPLKHTFEENMTICIESYTGSDKGGEGVKLEQMVLVSNSGCEPISTFPVETQLLESAVYGP